MAPASAEETGGGTVEVVGLTARELAALARPAAGAGDRLERLTVHTAEAAAVAGRPPVLGRREVAGDRLRFVPRYPFVPGQRYVARWHDPARQEASLELIFTPPAAPLPATTRVVALYPGGDELPENLLRLYLEFSAPMSRGGASAHVRLEEEDGPVVPQPFAAPEVELWDADRTRLTLLLDPGRIKRGVGPNQAQGPPLTAGRRYRLVVDPAWADAHGAPLAAGFARSFRVGPPDREPPRPKSWRIEPPAGPRAALVVAFPEALDRALALRFLAVVDGGGRRLAGRSQVVVGERAWSFRPLEPWQPGEYEVRVDARLEDPAGNAVGRPFEVALEPSPAAPAAPPAVVELRFRVR